MNIQESLLILDLLFYSKSISIEKLNIKVYELVQKNGLTKTIL